jgi:transcriptional regulator with PAS, ATPase and Fis domain
MLPPPLPSPTTIDPRMVKIYADAARVAQGEVSVLVLGESGTGKELLARYVHAASPRRHGPFVAVNCAALPRDLLEAELFGIERGAATGVSARPGKFEQAHGGTLFLDEIGDMAPETQAKILRVLQEGEVFRVGGREPRGADGRLISATNRPLDELLAGGHFRGDLYHRIADWRAELPPLRERRADIPNLAAHFLERESVRLGRPARGISRAALDTLLACPWPGNVRQLEREMARAALFLDGGDLLETRHLQVTGPPPEPAVATDLRSLLETVERREIERVLAACGGDTADAAKRLGLARSTLYRRLRDLGVTLPHGT